MADAAADQRPAPSRAQRSILLLESLVGFLIVVLSVAYAADLQRKVGLSIYDSQLLVASFSLALIAGFLAMARTAGSILLRAANLICAVAVLGAGGYLAVTYVDTSMEAPFLPGWLIVLPRFYPAHCSSISSDRRASASLRSSRSLSDTACSAI